MNTTTRYTADAVVIAYPEDRAHVLLIRRAADHDTEPGKWALPGGHVDPGETAEQAARRELEEETGLDLRDVDAPLVWVGQFDAPGRDPRGHYVSDAYVTVLTGLEDLTDVAGADDADAAEWVPVGQALDTPLAFDHGDILRAALSVAGLAA